MKITAHRLNKLTSKYYNKIYIYCRNRVSNDTDAYDITQDVFLSLLLEHKNVEYKTLKRWLYVTAHNKIVDYYKAKERENENRAKMEEYEEIPSPEDFVEEISEEELDACKDEILNSLTPDERELYEDVFVHKKSYSELSEQYKVSNSTMRKRVSRLKEKIKAAVRSHLQ